MTGTKEGAKKAAQRNKELYGEDFYRNIGKTGGSRKNANKGFGSATPEQRSEWGKKGGTRSKRGATKVEEEENQSREG